MTQVHCGHMRHPGRVVSCSAAHEYVNKDNPNCTNTVVHDGPTPTAFPCTADFLLDGGGILQACTRDNTYYSLTLKGWCFLQKQHGC